MPGVSGPMSPAGRSRSSGIDEAMVTTCPPCGVTVMGAEKGGFLEEAALEVGLTGAGGWAVRGYGGGRAGNFSC